MRGVSNGTRNARGAGSAQCLVSRWHGVRGTLHAANKTLEDNECAIAKLSKHVTYYVLSKFFFLPPLFFFSFLNHVHNLSPFARVFCIQQGS